MRLPNADKAVLEIEKLTDYCLNPTHPRGRHKARVFESVLGITAEDAPLLRTSLLHAAANSDAILGEDDDYGRRYMVESRVSGSVGDATVRSAWIVLAHEVYPRFVSCYVL